MAGEGPVDGLDDPGGSSARRRLCNAARPRNAVRVVLLLDKDGRWRRRRRALSVQGPCGGWRLRGGTPRTRWAKGAVRVSPPASHKPLVRAAGQPGSGTEPPGRGTTRLRRHSHRTRPGLPGRVSRPAPPVVAGPLDGALMLSVAVSSRSWEHGPSRGVRRARAGRPSPARRTSTPAWPPGSPRPQSGR